MSKENSSPLYFFIGARYGKEILLLAGIAIAIFAFLAVIVVIWASLPK